jgi:prepilin-type N-terminal cleavage/methylation domain-containing protein
MSFLTKKAFTIMEIMTVVIIVGVIAVFAIPNFRKTMSNSYQQDAITQLTSIHAAEEIYRAQNNGQYWPLSASTYTLSDINTNLGLGILANGMTYTCSGNASGTTYTCNATRASGALNVQVTQAALSTTSVPPNPQVVSSCPYGC